MVSSEHHTRTAQAQVQETELLRALPSIYTSLVPTIWYTSTWLSSAFNYYYMADVCHYIVGLLPYSYSTLDGQQELTKIPTLCCSKRSKGSSRLSYTASCLPASGGCGAANDLAAELAVPCPCCDDATSGHLAVAGVRPPDHWPPTIHAQQEHDSWPCSDFACCRLV